LFVRNGPYSYSGRAAVARAAICTHCYLRVMLSVRTTYLEPRISLSVCWVRTVDMDTTRAAVCVYCATCAPACFGICIETSHNPAALLQPPAKSLNSLGYLNCAQANQFKRQRKCGSTLTRARFMGATCLSARQRRSIVRGLQGRTASDIETGTVTIHDVIHISVFWYVYLAGCTAMLASGSC